MGLAGIELKALTSSLDHQMLFNVLTRMGGLAGASCRKANEVHWQLGI